MEAPAHPLGQAFVGREGYGGGAGVFGQDEGRVHRSGESAPGGADGGGDRGRVGRAGLPLDCIFPSFFLCSSFFLFFLFSFWCNIFSVRFPSVFSFVFPTSGWESYYDRLGRSGAKETDIYKQPPLLL